MNALLAPRFRRCYPCRPLLVTLLFLAASLPAQPTLATLRAEFEAGRHDKVLESVKAHAGRITDVEVVLLGAEAALHLGDWTHAGSLGAEATRLSPDDSRGYAMQGHAYWGSAKASAAEGGGAFTALTYQDAGIFYREARQKGGDTFENGYFEAEAFRAGGDLQKALEAIDASLTAKPDHWGAALIRAEILLDSGAPEDAVEALIALRRRSPKAPDAGHLLLRAVLATGDRERCRSLFLDLVREFPQDIDIYSPFETHFKRDDPPAFLKSCMEEAAKIHPPKVDRFPLWYTGHMALQERQYDKALDLLSQYRDQIPSSGDGYLAVGRVLTAMGRLDEARSEMLKAHSYGGVEKERLVVALEMLVTAMVDRRGYAPAAELQQVVQALALRPGDELNLGALLYNAGKRDEGLRVFEKLSQRGAELEGPILATAENYLALALVGLGRVAEARAAFKRSLAADDASSLDARENLGTLLTELGLGEEAAPHLEQVLKKDPARHRSRYHLMRTRYRDLLDAAR